MGIMRRSFRSLLPTGPPWRLGGTFGGIIDAIALSLDRVQVFVDDVRRESNPGSAEETLQQWYAQLGINYDDTQTLSKRQKRARSAYTAIGGQSKDYLEELIQRVYPGVFLDEVQIENDNQVGVGVAGLMVAGSYPSWVPEGELDDGEWHVMYYQVRGEIETIKDLTGLNDLLDRIAPANLEPVYNVDVLSITDTAQAGVGVSGLMRSGKE